MARIRLALFRARLAIATVALVYAASVLLGAVLAHRGSAFALRASDQIVGDAVRTSPILRFDRTGNHLAAAGLDALGNASAGLLGIPAGYGVVSGYGIAAYRGWVVSVDGEHRSRLASLHGAFYYLATLILQLLPFSLSGGAGVNLGFAAFRRSETTGYSGPRIPFLGIPRDALGDAGWIYLICLPLFACASVFEFTM